MGKALVGAVEADEDSIPTFSRGEKRNSRKPSVRTADVHAGIRLRVQAATTTRWAIFRYLTVCTRELGKRSRYNDSLVAGRLRG
jgi:hypothetical protein